MIVADDVYNWYLQYDAQWKTALDNLGNKVYKWTGNSTNNDLKTFITKDITIKENNTTLDEGIVISPRISATANAPYVLHLRW